MKQDAKKTPARLRDMAPEYALARCIGITQPIWSHLDYTAIRELWDVFNSYILNDYQENGIQVPADLSDAWERCKKKIDREAKR